MSDKFSLINLQNGISQLKESLEFTREAEDNPRLFTPFGLHIIKFDFLFNSQAPGSPGMAIGPVLRRSSLSLASYLKTAKNDSP